MGVNLDACVRTSGIYDSPSNQWTVFTQFGIVFLLPREEIVNKQKKSKPMLISWSALLMTNNYPEVDVLRAATAISQFPTPHPPHPLLGILYAGPSRALLALGPRLVRRSQVSFRRAVHANAVLGEAAAMNWAVEALLRAIPADDPFHMRAESTILVHLAVVVLVDSQGLTCGLFLTLVCSLAFKGIGIK